MFGNMHMTKAVLNIIFVNVLVFLIWHLVPAESTFMYEYFLLWKSDLIIPRPPDLRFFNPVQILSHFFSHNSLFHIIFNMLALASLGPMIEMVIGIRRFIYFYLFCGLFSGVLIAFLDPSMSPVLGASAAISGVVVAFAFYYPHQKLSIFFLPAVESKKLAIYIAAISALLIILRHAANFDPLPVSHFGHLMGMFSAYIFLQFRRIIRR